MRRSPLSLVLAGWGALGAACATPPGPGPIVTVTCLPLKAYSVADERALGAAVGALPPGSPLIEAMADYGALRAADRACRDARPTEGGGAS